jgi:flagellin
MSINLSSNARTGLTVLRNVAEQMATTQTRLVTGKAVNSPLDNVSKFFTAASMDSRAASIDALMDNINKAQSSMKAASEGIKGIQGLIKEARGLTSQALTSTKLDQTKVSGTATGLTAATAITAADTLTLTTDSGTYTYAAAAGGGSIGALITGINASGTGVKAELVEGKLSLTSATAETITIAGTGTGLTAAGLTAGATEANTNSTRAALATQFDALRSEINQIAKDAGINGLNLLAGDVIQLPLNENGSSKTTINGTTVNAESLGVTAAGGTWQTDENIDASLKSLIAAGSSLEATAASFSSNQSIINARKDFNASLSDILKSSASSLTAADMDQEAANLVALQTRQQMATTALSIMQSSETTALRLLS